jgi:cation transport regulator ChaC
MYVFGYGSLLERWSGRRGMIDDGPAVCELRNYRRTWNVAMDNTQTIPGYKHYVDATTGAREPWFVAFLDIVPESGARVNGVLFEVSHDQLARLDERERNYQRIEVSQNLSVPVDDDVWVYVGSDAARRRFRRGRRSRRAVISREYYHPVLQDFAHISPEAVKEFTARTDPPPCPIVDLLRIDHPAGAAATRDR